MTKPPARPRREQLLHLLGNGERYSGEHLASQLGITRAAVWKAVNSLRKLGIAMKSLHHGYQLPLPVEMYDAERLTTLLHGNTTHAVQVQCLFNVGSTNQHVSAQTIALHQPVLCVAELQYAGRGRRGRSWVAPFGAGISMSLGVAFDTLPPDMSALSLVIGVALVRVLRRHDVPVQLKWPNDVLWQGQKLAGVLIDMRGEPNGAAQVVIGIGLNIRLPESVRALLSEQKPICDLQEIIGAPALQRNDWVARFTREALSCVEQFTTQGFAAFHAEWQSYDALHQQPVRVLEGDYHLDGVAVGVSADGSLLVQTAAGIKRFLSGEVSVRPQ